MGISASTALWFLPFVLPICFYVAFTDMREMRITNQAVIALACVYIVVGPFALGFSEEAWTRISIGPVSLSLPDYLWGLLTMIAMLLLGVFLNAAGAMGAGDAKFIAAASGFIALADVRLVIALLAACLLAAHVTHRLVKLTPMRQVAPHWKSWDVGKKFPMGFALAGTLAIYLCLGVVFGS